MNGSFLSGASRPTRRCSGRALRHEILAILGRDSVLSVVPCRCGTPMRVALVSARWLAEHAVAADARCATRSGAF